MPILNEGDHARHTGSLRLLSQSRPPQVGLNSVDQTELWGVIEDTFVPRLVERLVVQARVAYSAGGNATARCGLQVDADLVPAGMSMHKMTKLQLMLDRMMDYHPLRDAENVSRKDAARLRKYFKKAIEERDASYQIAVEPQFYAINDSPGKMLAAHTGTLIVLEPKRPKPNMGPRRYIEEARLQRELLNPPSE